MKSILLSATLATLLALPASAQVSVPEVQDYSAYTGTSFTANWNAPSGLQCLLSVYREGENSESVTEDFTGIRQNEGRIDTTSPAYPEGWDINVTTQGATDMVFYGGRNHLLLDASGDAVTTPLLVGGNLESFVLHANLVNADGIARENSSIFVVEVYDKAGALLTSGRIEALYFASREDFDLVEAFGYTPFNVGKVRIGIVKPDGQDVGDLAINNISYAFKAPEYVFEDRRMEEGTTSFEVQDLDPELAYFYYARSTDGTATSDVSPIIRVDGFLDVTVLEASDITTQSFTANWQRLPKATGYTLQPYKVETYAEDGLKEILYDSFSKSTEGTFDNPVKVTNADDVADAEGWTGQNMLSAEGMLGANAGRFPMNLSFLRSPHLNLASDGGKYTVHIKAYGTSVNYISVYRVYHLIDTDSDGIADALNIHKTQAFDSNGYTEDTWEMDDGAENMVLAFEENKLAKFFLDEITVTQTTKAGEVIRQTLTPVTIEDGSTTSYTLTGLDAGGLYGYTVTGMRTDGYGFKENSGTSEMVLVRLSEPDGIVPVTDRDSVSVTAYGGTLILNLGSPQPVLLYTLDGRLVHRFQYSAGQHTLRLPHRGTFLLKTATKAFRLITR